MRELLAAKDNSLIKDQRGRVALFLAIEEGHIAVVRELLQSGNWQFQLTISTHRGGSPSHVAVKNGHEAITELLLKKG